MAWHGLVGGVDRYRRQGGGGAMVVRRISPAAHGRNGRAIVGASPELGPGTRNTETRAFGRIAAVDLPDCIWGVPAHGRAATRFSIEIRRSKAGSHAGPRDGPPCRARSVLVFGGGCGHCASLVASRGLVDAPATAIDQRIGRRRSESAHGRRPADAFGVPR